MFIILLIILLLVNKLTLTCTSGQEVTSKDILKCKQTAHQNYNTCLKLQLLEDVTP